MNINVLAFSGFVNFIAAAFLAIHSLAGRRKTPHALSFTIFSFGVALYGFFYLLWATAPRESAAMTYFTVLFAAIILINMSYLYFVFDLVGITRTKTRELTIVWVISIVFLILNFGHFMYENVELRHNLGFWPIPKFYFDIYLVFWFFQCFYGLYFLLREIIYGTGIRREQFKYITFGLALGFAGGASNWPVWYGISLPPYPNILISVGMMITYYAKTRYQLIDFKVFLARTILFAILYVFVFGIPLFLSHNFPSTWEFSIYLAIMLATLGPVLYYFLDRKTQKILLAENTRYQRILTQMTEGLIREHNLERLLRLTVLIVKRALNVRFAAILLRDEDGQNYRIRAMTHTAVKCPFLVFPVEDPLVRFIEEKGEAFTCAELHGDIKAAMCAGFESDLVIPAFKGKLLLGFLILGEKLNRTIYSMEDITIFKALSNQLALVIDNCMFMDEFKQTQQKLAGAEKLAAIGGMADGVAHQIKNRLSQFSVAGEAIVSEVDKIMHAHPMVISHTPAIQESMNFFREIAASIMENVKKTSSVIRGILNFARTEEKDGYFSDFDITDIIQQSVELIKVKHRLDVFPLKNELSGDSVYGVKAQLLECVYNALDNSFEAIMEKYNYFLNEAEKQQFVPEIVFKLLQIQQRAVIMISDNGIGIKDENKMKVFSAFFTTKSSFKSGTGIGAYVMKRIIEENHHGRVWFESEYGKGTTLYIELPGKKI